MGWVKQVKGLSLAVPAVIGGWLLLAWGCKMAEGQTFREGAKLTIATWNIQALFDAEESGNEYQEYRRDAGWTGEKYRARLQAIAQGVERMGSPDILALQEVENENILRDLAEGPLAKRGYGWTFFARLPGASLGIGVLSRLPLEKTRAHSITRGEETIPRPVMEATIKAESSPLTLLICHWKSKLGNLEVNEELRRAAAEVITRRMRELQTEAPGTPVLVLGDLNENHDEFYRQAGAFASALLPDDPMAASLAGGETSRQAQDFLAISREKPPAARKFPPGTAVFYSPWYEAQGGSLNGTVGSYLYKNNWETIDHFLLPRELFDGELWEFLSWEIMNKEPFTGSSGRPNAYNPRTGNGLSDHLPLRLTLELVE